MGLKDYIDKRATSAAIVAVNNLSVSITGQVQANQQTSGLWSVRAVKTNEGGQTLVEVTNDSGQVQTVQYVGSDYLYPGGSVYVSNGLAQS